MNKTSIEWCDYSWNPIRARVKQEHISNPAYRPTHSGTFCTRISPGCTHCYASTINKRFGNGLEYTVPNLEKVEFFIDEKILEEPLRRKKPAKIFVGDMFDLFHEAIPDEMLTKVLAVIALSSNHTFQLLTKRAERMRDTLDFEYSFWGEVAVQIEAIGYTISPCIGHLVDDVREGDALPLKNLWLGTSVESQQYADQRIPLLLETPAAVRFLSVEPMLEALTLEPYICRDYRDGTPDELPKVDWVIVGGESGPGARPFDLAWAESLLTQCRAAGVPFFMKQMGAKPQRDGSGYIGQFDGYRRHEADRKGGNMDAWPPELRVREFPAETLVSA